MVCIEKCLHFKRKCRHHPHPILDILPVYLTRGISIASGLFVSSIPFFGTRKTPSWKQGPALTKRRLTHRKYCKLSVFRRFLFCFIEQVQALHLLCRVQQLQLPEYTFSDAFHALNNRSFQT